MNTVKIKSLLGFWCGMCGLSINILETPAVKAAIEANNPDDCWAAMVDHQSQYRFDGYESLNDSHQDMFRYTWMSATIA